MENMEEILELVRKYTGHENVFLTSRGNAAIWIILKTVYLLSNRETVIVPDQSGWITYLEYPRKLELEIETVKTGYGILDLQNLEEKAKIANALIYQNPAGYFAEQPFEEIYKICNKNGCFVIMDISGCVSDELMYNPKYADFFVCSFGKWKIINAGYGGFLSAKAKEHLEAIKKMIDKEDKSNNIFHTFDSKYGEKVLKCLKSAPKKIVNLYKECEKIKYELKDFNILHKHTKGIVVVVKYESEEVKQKIIEYCNWNGYEYAVCPRYIRVNDNAISIEVKRLDL